MYTIIIATITLLTVVITLNVAIYRYIVMRAIKKFIVPKLQGAGLSFSNYKWLGFFGRGDFKNDDLILVPSFSGPGVISIYIEIFYTETSIKKKVTVRIDTFFIFIVKVLYSNEF